MSFLYNTIVELEERFDFDTSHRWFQNNWTISVYACVFYAITIFGLKQWMRTKTEGYNIRRWLFLWSTGLAVFSIIGSSINGSKLLSAILKNGLVDTICVHEDAEDPTLLMHLARNRFGLWTWCFVLSKIVELGDTYFILLKKQKLIFLHWYHHITVLLYTWYAYKDFTAVNQFFQTINYAVHSIMYTYYSVRASGVYKPPIWINMLITIFQIVQMIIGLSLNIYVYLNVGDSDWKCDSNSEVGLHLCHVAFAMYFTYFLLFFHFFLSTYIFKDDKKSGYKTPVVTKDVIHNQTKGIKNGVLKCD